MLEFLTSDANDASELLLHASLYVFMVFLGRYLVKKAIYREIPILKTWVEYKQTVAQCAFKRRNNIEINESQYAIGVQTPNLFLFLTP